MSGPQKWGMPAPRPRAKRTLNVLYRLTTEMGEGRGWENREYTLAKMTLEKMSDQLTTEMSHQLKPRRVLN